MLLLATRSSTVSLGAARNSAAVMADRRRVLIADDNNDWARGMSFVLEDQGFAVQTARVVVLDIRMPRMTRRSCWSC